MKKFKIIEHKELNWITLLARIVSVFMVVVDLEMDFKGWVRFGYAAIVEEYSK